MYHLDRCCCPIQCWELDLDAIRLQLRARFALLLLLLHVESVAAISIVEVYEQTK